MNVEDYLEIRELFQTKWDPAVLAVLAERPYRFLALVRRVRAVVDSEILDGSVARSLDRLQQLGYVHTRSATAGDRTVVLYALTERGIHVVTAYQAIIAAYRQVRLSHERARA